MMANGQWSSKSEYIRIYDCQPNRRIQFSFDTSLKIHKTSNFIANEISQKIGIFDFHIQKNERAGEID